MMKNINRIYMKKKKNGNHEILLNNSNDNKIDMKFCACL